VNPGSRLDCFRSRLNLRPVRTSRAIQQTKAILLVSPVLVRREGTYQSKIPDAFLVSQNCFSPRLKSSPLAAFGSLSGFLQPGAVHADNQLDSQRSVKLLTADSDYHSCEKEEFGTESMEDKSRSGLV
jgi:hypothetical protein